MIFHLKAFARNAGRKSSKENGAIFKSIIPEIAKRNFSGIMLVVANPVDILT